MLEIIAMILILLWVAGLLTGALGLAIHILLAAALIALLVDWYRRPAPPRETSPARMLSIMLRGSGPGLGKRVGQPPPKPGPPEKSAQTTP